MAHTRDALTTMMAMKNGGTAAGVNPGVALPVAAPAASAPAPAAASAGGVPRAPVMGANPELTRRLMEALSGEQASRERAEQGLRAGLQFNDRAGGNPYA